MSNIWYIIAAWAGARRVKDQRYENDCTFYLRQHMAWLAKLKNSLARVVIVANQAPNEPVGFQAYLDQLNGTTLPSGAQVSTHRRENTGLSYGAWSWATGKALVESVAPPSYLILQEDDYTFLQDDFDAAMVEMLKAQGDGCGYLCGCAAKGNPRSNYPFHAVCSTGIARLAVLKRLYERHGKIPHYPKADYAAHDQLLFSAAFIEEGLEIKDCRDRFCVAFQELNFGTKLYHNSDLPMLLGPLQDPGLLADHRLRGTLMNQHIDTEGNVVLVSQGARRSAKRRIRTSRG